MANYSTSDPTHVDLGLQENMDDSFQIVTPRRKRTASEVSNNSDQQKNTKRSVDFGIKVIIKSIPPSRPLNQVNSIQLKKELSTCKGIESVKFISGGRLLVHLKSERHINDISAIDKLVGQDVDYHQLTDKHSSGVIHGVPPAISDEELLKCLEDTGVNKVQRFFKGKGDSRNPTYSVRLFFSCAEPPTHVTLGYSRHNISAYVPPPLRCYSCQRYGHVADECRSNKRCTRCGKMHNTSQCTLSAEQKTDFHCVNCGGMHSSAYWGCPKYKEQAKINNLVVAEKITRKEAKTIVVSSIPKQPKTPVSIAPVVSQPPVSYASVVSQSQTNLHQHTTAESPTIPAINERPTNSRNIHVPVQKPRTHQPAPQIQNPNPNLIKMIEKLITLVVVLFTQSSGVSNINMEGILPLLGQIFGSDLDVESVVSSINALKGPHV